MSALLTSAGATAAIAIVSGLAGVIATRALGPYERGLLATAVVFTGILGSLVAVGLPQALTYFVAKEPAAASRYVGTALAMGVAGGSVLGATGAACALLFVESEAAAPMAVLFAGVTPVILGGLAIAAVLGTMRYLDWSLLRLLNPGIALVGVIAIVSLGDASPVKIALVTAGAGIVQSVAAIVRVQREGLLGRPSRTAARRLLSYGWRQLLAGAAWLLTYKLDQAVLSFVVAPAALGLYAVAASVGEVIAPVAASAGSVMLARVAAGGRAEARHSLGLSILFCLTIAGSLAFVAFLTAEDLLKQVFGEGFGAGADEMRILLVGSVALAVATVLADTLRGLGRPLVPARAELGGAFTTAVLLSALVPPFGIMGAAIASAISYSFVMILLGLEVRRSFREVSHLG